MKEKILKGIIVIHPHPCMIQKINIGLGPLQQTTKTINKQDQTFLPLQQTIADDQNHQAHPEWNKWRL